MRGGTAEHMHGKLCYWRRYALFVSGCLIACHYSYHRVGLAEYENGEVCHWKEDALLPEACLDLLL